MQTELRRSFQRALQKIVPENHLKQTTRTTKEGMQNFQQQKINESSVFTHTPHSATSDRNPTNKLRHENIKETTESQTIERCMDTYISI